MCMTVGKVSLEEADKREVVDELEGGNLVSGLLDGLSELGVCMGVSRVAFAFFNVPYPAQTSC